MESSVTDELCLELAERITKFYRSFDTSEFRAQHKAKLQVAIGQAIVDELIIATQRELTPDAIPLGDCPVGLFIAAKTGTLCMKTEYALDSYIVESGERFWGGTHRPNELAEVLVVPVSIADTYWRLKKRSEHPSTEKGSEK